MSNDKIEPSDLENLPASEQKALMKEWFLQNFEDPAERTPYESAEGGYIWIWGGPYDAKEELCNYFYDFVDEDVIDELVQELEQYCLDWAPTEKPGDYEDYIVDDISSITKSHENFLGSISDIKTLLEVNVPIEVQCQYLRLLYVNVITALETFLSDAFISRTMTEELAFETFVTSNPDFKSKKISYSEIIEAMKDLKSTVKTHLLEVIWHNLDRVSNMYNATFNVSFPEDLGDIYRAVLRRHDIVHRNGKDKEGKDIEISKEDVLLLIGKVENLASDIDIQMAPNKKRGPFSSSELKR